MNESQRDGASTPVSKFRELERNCPVYDLAAGSWKLWPIIRMQYFYGFRRSNPQGRSKRPEFGIFLKGLFSSALGFLGKADILYFSDSSELKMINGKYRNKQFWRLYELLAPQRSQLFERYWQSGENRGDPRPTATYLFDFVAKLLSVLMPIPPIEGGAALQCLKERSGLEIPIGSHFIVFRAYYSVCKLMLRLKRPKVIFLTEYYCTFFLGLIAAARELSIPVIELQHGIVNDAHPAYNWDSSGERIVPDQFWTFGEREKVDLSDRGFVDQSQIFSIGHSYLNYLSSIKSPVIVGGRDFGPTICVTLQNSFLIPMYDFVQAVARENPGISFTLIPRGREIGNGNQYDWPSNVRFELEKDFYTVVRASNYHLTISSTCALESLFFQVPNILFNYKGLAHEAFAELELSKLVGNPIEFKQALYSLWSVPFESKRFSKNYDENVRESLKKILG